MQIAVRARPKQEYLSNMEPAVTRGGNKELKGHQDKGVLWSRGLPGAARPTCMLLRSS